MYELEDIRQDAFSVFLRVYRLHPDLEEPDLFRIYKRGVQGRVDNRSRQCFPNSHAFVKDQGQLVLELDEGMSGGVTAGNAETFLTFWSDIFSQLPGELVDVLKLLIKDFLGVEHIKQRRRKKLNGQNRVEPLNISIARALELDPSRDLLKELEEIMRSRV